jgi:hypothetical protein
MKTKNKLIRIHWDFDCIGEYSTDYNELELERAKRIIRKHFHTYRQKSSNPDLFLMIGAKITDWDNGIIEYRVRHWDSKNDRKKAMDNFTINIPDWKTI